MGVDREDFSDDDPIASDAAQLFAAAYANVDRSITASSVTLRAVREAARNGLKTS